MKQTSSVVGLHNCILGMLRAAVSVWGLISPEAVFTTGKITIASPRFTYQICKYETNANAFGPGPIETF